jgi:hypothetical protein
METKKSKNARKKANQIATENCDKITFNHLVAYIDPVGPPLDPPGVDSLEGCSL